MNRNAIAPGLHDLTLSITGRTAILHPYFIDGYGRLKTLAIEKSFVWKTFVFSDVSFVSRLAANTTVDIVGLNKAVSLF